MQNSNYSEPEYPFRMIKFKTVLRPFCKTFSLPSNLWDNGNFFMMRFSFIDEQGRSTPYSMVETNSFSNNSFFPISIIPPEFSVSARKDSSRVIKVNHGKAFGFAESLDNEASSGIEIYSKIINPLAKLTSTPADQQTNLVGIFETPGPGENGIQPGSPEEIIDSTPCVSPSRIIYKAIKVSNFTGTPTVTASKSLIFRPQNLIGQARESDYSDTCKILAYQSPHPTESLDVPHVTIRVFADFSRLTKVMVFREDVSSGNRDKIVIDSRSVEDLGVNSEYSIFDSSVQYASKYRYTISASTDSGSFFNSSAECFVELLHNKRASRMLSPVVSLETEPDTHFSMSARGSDSMDDKIRSLVETSQLDMGFSEIFNSSSPGQSGNVSSPPPAIAFARSVVAFIVDRYNHSTGQISRVGLSRVGRLNHELPTSGKYTYIFNVSVVLPEALASNPAIFGSNAAIKNFANHMTTTLGAIGIGAAQDLGEHVIVGRTGINFVIDYEPTFIQPPVIENITYPLARSEEYKRLGDGARLISWTQNPREDLDYFVICADYGGITLTLGKLDYVSSHTSYSFLDSVLAKEVGSISYFVVAMGFDNSELFRSSQLSTVNRYRHVSVPIDLLRDEETEFV